MKKKLFLPLYIKSFSIEKKKHFILARTHSYTNPVETNTKRKFTRHSRAYNLKIKIVYLQFIYSYVRCILRYLVIQVLICPQHCNTLADFLVGAFHQKIHGRRLGKTHITKVFFSGRTTKVRVPPPPLGLIFSKRFFFFKFFLKNKKIRIYQ